MYTYALSLQLYGYALKTRRYLEKVATSEPEVWQSLRLESIRFADLFPSNAFSFKAIAINVDARIIKIKKKKKKT